MKDEALKPIFSVDDLVSSYTRQHAIADGVLIDVSTVAAEAGFRWPVAITRALGARIDDIPPQLPLDLPGWNGVVMSRKSEAGRQFAESQGREYMAEIGRRGAAKTRQREAAGDLVPPATCPRCGKAITSWRHWLGHQGLHALADRYFSGDVAKAQEHLRRNGYAKLYEGISYYKADVFGRYIPLADLADLPDEVEF